MRVFDGYLNETRQQAYENFCIRMIPEMCKQFGLPKKAEDRILTEEAK
jgi:hypothetical protein